MYGFARISANLLELFSGRRRSINWQTVSWRRYLEQCTDLSDKFQNRVFTLNYIFIVVLIALFFYAVVEYNIFIGVACCVSSSYASIFFDKNIRRIQMPE